VEELWKELCQENKVVTLMTTENWAAGYKAYLYKNPRLHFKIPCMSKNT
jgi:hypothetical protein